MITINDKEILVYNLDTIDSILIRIASYLDTIPKYLYFPEGIPKINDFYEEKNIIVENFLIYIINADNFSGLIDNNEEKINQMGLNIITDILRPFLVYNLQLLLLNQIDQGTAQLTLSEDIKKYNFKNIDLENLWKEKKEIKDNIKDSIKNNKKSNTENIEKNKKIEDTKGISYTPFELENSRFQLIFDVENISLIEIFNLIQLNPRIPFANYNNFYKILKDYIPSKDWNISLEDVIIVKLCHLINLPNIIKYEYYTDITIIIEDNKLVFEVELKIDKQNISRELFVEQIMTIFPNNINFNTMKIQETNAKGSFYFPKANINNYILSDLIMNDIFFSSMLAIDEHDKATKIKNSLYIHFYNNAIGKISANITSKISEKGDPMLRGKDIKELFKYGSEYIRVRISYANNINIIFMFQDLLSKILTIYYSKETEIFNIYKSFIPNFGIKEQQKIKEMPELRLKDIAPEVFISGYTKKCNAQPTIISDEEVEQVEKEGKQVMRYPLTDVEGIIPRNYICNYSKEIYPGLRENPLSNNNIVPYLPCCFKKDHSNIKGNIYGHYYRDEELKNKEDKKQQNFIITHKFTPFNWYGYLPDNLIKMFNLFDDRDNYTFIRKGVSHTKSSFLECVMEALDTKTKISNIPERNREAFLIKKRKELGNDLSLVALCKQEMYDFTTEEIQNMIKNHDKYFDPQYFTSLLENYYNCNIYVFNRKNMVNNAELILPRYIKAFYKNKNDGKSIFIYQHNGSSSDHSKFPKCELILRWKETNVEQIEYNFNSKNNISKGINEIYEKLRLSYSLTEQIYQTIFNIDTKIVNVLGQGIDSYGKTRMIEIEYKNKIITLLTTPLQPLRFPEINNWKINKVDANIVLNLAKDLDINLISQNVIQNVAKTYNGILGNVEISIPINDNIPSLKILNEKIGINYLENNLSELDNYNKHKKLSRYILSYLFWLYSKYLNEKNETISLESIKRFINDNIEIIHDFEYGYVSKYYNMNSGIMKNSKLIVKSEETLKRLIYSLKLFSRQRINLLNFYKKISIDDYYVEINDFDQYQFQVILQGNNAVEKWIEEQKLNYILFDSVQLNMLLKPYFFKNKLINDKIYLAQNTNTLQKAILIAQIWNEQGYNIGGDPIIEDENIYDKFFLYSYKNSNNIKQYTVGGQATKGDPILLGYRVNNDSFYTVLLEL